MDKEKINEKSSMFDKAAFILRYIFFAFLVWSYWSTIYTILREGVSGAVVGLFAIAMFFVFKEGINPIKMNHKEFGKYTDIIGILITLTFAFILCYLSPLLGVGSYK